MCDVFVLLVMLMIVFWLGECIVDLMVMYCFDLCMVLVNMVGSFVGFFLIGLLEIDGMFVGM